MEAKGTRDYRAEKPFLICIDSDGCAFDTMEIKHKECFIPAMIQAFDLQPVSRYAREAWEYVNLYSRMRGMNRFLTLLLTLDALKTHPAAIEREFTPPALPEIRAWAERSANLNNASLEAEPQTEEIRRTLDWSLDCNKRIRELVKNVPPFPYAAPSVRLLAEKADIVVVSATNEDALLREWEHGGLLPLVKRVCGQESGSKKEVIRSIRDHYDRDHILMMGDAPGDRKAAEENSVSFYPILPNAESKSWKRFLEGDAETFFTGRNREEMLGERYEEFLLSLPEKAPWQE